MKLAELIECLPSERSCRPRDCVVNDVTRDIRSAGPGIVYFVVPGSPVVSPYLAMAAVRRGAAAVVCGRDTPLPRAGRCIRVGDPQDAYARAAAAVHGNPQQRIKFVGVRGPRSRQVAEWMHGLLRECGRNAGLIGERGFWAGDWRVPHLGGGVDARRVYEWVGRLGRMGGDVCIVERTEALDSGAVLAPVAFFAEVDTGPAWNGLAPERHVSVADVRWTGSGTAFQLTVAGEKGRVRLPLVGRTAMQDLLTALRSLAGWGVDPGALVRAVSRVGWVEGSCELVPVGRRWGAMVDDARTPAALGRVLAEARGVTAARLIAVVGGGQHQSPEERRAMGHVAGRYADVVIATSDNPGILAPRAMALDVALGSDHGTRTEIRVCPVRAQAIRSAAELAREGDMVVVTGNALSCRQEMEGAVVPFDDRDHLKAAAGFRLSNE